MKIVLSIEKKEKKMKKEIENLKEKFLVYIESFRRFPYTLREHMEFIESEISQYLELNFYIDSFGYMDFERAALDCLLHLTFLQYSKYLLEEDETLEIEIAGKANDSRYIIVKVITKNDFEHPDYYIVNPAVDGYVSSMLTSEAQRVVEHITSRSPVMGRPVRFISMLYDDYLSSFEIFMHQFTFYEKKNRAPVSNSLNENKTFRKHLLDRKKYSS